MKILKAPSDPRAQRIAEILQRSKPDILLSSELNWGRDGQAADDFAANNLSVSHGTAGTGTDSAPISFP